ncbi:DUF2939 domain-containing protein [Alteriqipengyuania flavescens]|uniref:DUF2939 domain-containing protein n=1 Tax=Alteriqipengyuania flavescens TaxID=3053610 RepID=UPI0025B504F7|nr:DUF2939 domain-containing protein [Alteriqipengyuania flavescens]WJY19365.1 DUF2939 domain-containing protein [Alteriqipengyuania flavescens]WJY25307.1 DUF2939 domain-containing protein [Alteriqipengyuania flavescens]
MRKLLLVLFILVVVVGAWWWESPVMALKNLRDAAQDRDAAKLSRSIDLPAFRASLKNELGEMVEKEAAGNPIAGVAGRVAVDRAVDQLITADGIAAAMADEPRDPLLRNIAGALGAVAMQQQNVENFDIDRGFNTFTVSRVNGEGAALATLIFHRDGLGWKLSGIDVP